VAGGGQPVARIGSRAEAPGQHYVEARADPLPTLAVAVPAGL
jgi:hypothetical protein